MVRCSLYGLFVFVFVFVFGFGFEVRLEFDTEWVEEVEDCVLTLKAERIWAAWARPDAPAPMMAIRLMGRVSVGMVIVRHCSAARMDWK